jgi:outer membrane protein assembly factor BamB
MRLTITISLLLILVTACVSGPKYAIDPPDSIKPKIKIATQWVSHSGEKYFRQENQLPLTVVGNKIYLANADGDVAAMNVISGKVLWKKVLHHSEARDRISAGPGYGGGIVVLANDKAQVFALKDGSGEELWRQKVSSEVLAKPVVSGDKVFVQTVDDKVFALAKDSGKKLWVASRQIPPLTLRGNSTPLVIKDKLIVGFSTGELVAYNIETGKETWEAAIAVPKGRTDLARIVDIDGLFTENGDTIYVVSYQGKIAAVAVGDGHLIWSRDMSSYTGVATDDHQIYLTDEKGFIWALDKNSGATLWRQEKLADRYLTAPTVLGNTVVVADIGGYVFWLSKEDGGILAQKDFYKVYSSSFFNFDGEVLEDKDYGVTTPMKVADNRLLVRDNEGTLAVFSVIK